MTTSALMLVVGLAGCAVSDPKCEELPAGESRDWCLFERVGRSLDSEQIQAAVDDAALIEGPVARGAAVDRILGTLPGELSRSQAEALCATLAAEAAETCRNRWDRPHLWDR